MEKPLILLDFLLRICYNKDRFERKKGDFEVDLLVTLQTELQALKSQLKEKQEQITFQKEQIEFLEKLNHWYIEQLKLR